MTNPTNHSPQGEGEANEAALRQFPNGIGQDGIFDMLQEARRLGFIYGANWQKSTYDLMRSIINKMLNIDKPTYTEAELVIIKQSIEAG